MRLHGHTHRSRQTPANSKRLSANATLLLTFRFMKRQNDSSLLSQSAAHATAHNINTGLCIAGSPSVRPSVCQARTKLIKTSYCLRRVMYLMACFEIDNARWNVIYTVSQKKNSQNCFYHNFVKFLLTLIIFGVLMAKMTKLCKVHSLSTPSNLCQCTTMWNTDAPNCYIMRRLVSSKRCIELIRHKIH